MKFFVAIMSVAFFFSSCADKSDPGLRNDTLNNTVVDSLKGKKPAEVLKLKYSTATAVCKLERIADSEEDQTAGLVVPPATEEGKLYIDLKKWSETDPELKPATAKVIKTADGVVLTVDLSVKIEIVNLTFKRNNLVYFMKHSPQITYEYSGKLEGGSGTVEKGTGFINERMNTAAKVGAVTVGEGAEARAFSYFLTCSNDTVVMKDSKNAEEYNAQFEVLDCNAPKDSQKKLAAANCKKD